MGPLGRSSFKTDPCLCNPAPPSVLTLSPPRSAKGGHGDVYQARDTKLDRDVALKLQRFASVQSVVQNLFRVGRHLLRPVHHRLLRARAFVKWDVVTCAC